MKHKTRKDKRKDKTGAKSESLHCQNNGRCVACRSARLYKNSKREAAQLNQLLIK